MRPVPADSTDLLYKDHYPDEDLRALGNALGVGDLKVITKTTLKPERMLYHACINGVQTYLRLPHHDEAERAKAIADVTDQMYAALKPEFMQALAASQPELLAKEQEAKEFCSHIAGVEDKKSWDATRYNNTWNVNDYPMRWQKKAIETYRTARTRIESGLYTPRDGETAGSLTTQWSLQNLRYKHCRDLARGRIEDYIQQHFTPEQRLTMVAPEDRFTTMFIGGMASGKSALTQHYLSQLPEDVRGDLVMHNADYLKYALYRSAKEEGMLPAEHNYTGAEVQAESSNALYEATRKRGYLARQKYAAPNVVLNSIVLGSFEVQEGIAGGGKVVAHHIFITPEDAIRESEKRAASGDRCPSASDVQWSTSASAKSLLLLAEPAYRKLDVTVHLYKRSAGKAPEHYGTIDAAHSMVYVHNLEAMAQLSHSIYPAESPEKALQSFMEQYTQAGYGIALAKDAAHDLPVALLSADKTLTLSDTEAFEALGDHKQAFLQLAECKKVGMISIDTLPRSELRYGRT